MPIWCLLSEINAPHIDQCVKQSGRQTDLHIFAGNFVRHERDFYDPKQTRFPQVKLAENMEDYSYDAAEDFYDTNNKDLQTNETYVSNLTLKTTTFPNINISIPDQFG